jgi:hypothetical protein
MNRTGPTNGKFAYFDCATASAWAGTQLQTNTQHTVLVNNAKTYDVMIWTGALNWPGSDQ